MAAHQKRFDNFESIFGEAIPEYEPRTTTAAAKSVRPFLFHVYSLDSSRLEIIASDFHSLTFHCILTVHQIDDLQDDIGIGGSWSEFVDYLIASLSSENVKLILDGSANETLDSGIAHAKLVAHKSKGLPRISLSLIRLMNSSANEAMSKFSVALFRAFKNKHSDVVKEHEHLLQVKGALSSEKERSESLQKQLDAFSFVNKRKVSKLKLSDNTSFVSDSVSDNKGVLAEAQLPSVNYTANTEAASTKDTQPMKVSQVEPKKAGQRAALVSRRARARGVSLQDDGDDDGT